MRIFVPTGIFHPEPGGPATYLKHFLPELTARGHDVTVLTFGSATGESYPYPVTRIPRRFYPIRQTDYYRAATRLWTDHDLAYVHGQTIPLPPKISPRVIKIVGDSAWERAMNRGWVKSSTDIDDFQVSRYAPQVEFNKFIRAQRTRQYDHVIVPSAYLKRMVVNWGVDQTKVSVVYNALQIKEDIPQISQAEARKQLGLPDAPMLFTAARITPWKGIDHVIRALARLKDIRLVIAGQGETRTSLEALSHELGISDRIIFLGNVPREKVLMYYRAADYTMLYSGYEGLPHVLLESLYTGTPVIASDKGGNPEVVRHGVNGLLAPYVNVDALTELIAHAFSSDHREKFAANTSQELERFMWPTLVDQTLQILESFG